MSTNENGTAHRKAIHPELESVALLDLDDVCAVARLSKSYVLDEIANARGPKPIRFGSRCTRYLLTDVRDWLAARIAAAESTDDPGEVVRTRMKRAAQESVTKRTKARGQARAAA